MNDNNILEDYKTEPIYLFATEALKMIDAIIDKASIDGSNPNLKVRLIGEAKRKELTILKYQIIDVYHKICKETGLEDD